MLVDKSLREFFDEVASRNPTPGGGSVSAAAGSLGAALGVMTARFTKDPSAEEASVRLQKELGDFVGLIDEDAEAYGKVNRAMSLPKETAEEKAARKEELQSALKEASEVPLRGMEVAVRSLQALEDVARVCNPRLVSDLGASALLLEAGLFGCSLNVRVNAQSIKDPAFVEKLAQEAGKYLQEGGAARSRIMQEVERSYGRQ